MDLFASLSPELQLFLFGVTGNALGDLGGEFASHLIRSAGRGVRSLFTDERTAALTKATTQAMLAAVKDWQALPDEYADLWDRYGAWLLEPVVLGEFRKLLAPTADMALDYALLQEEFEAAGLAVGDWGKPDFAALVQDMVGAFYLAAAEEPLLQEPLKLGVLRSTTFSKRSTVSGFQRSQTSGRSSAHVTFISNRIRHSFLQRHDCTFCPGSLGFVLTQL